MTWICKFFPLFLILVFPASFNVARAKCVDQRTYCNTLVAVHSGKCPEDNTWLRKKCPAACKLCPESECKDLYPKCAEWAKDNRCTTSELKELLQLSCKKSCGLCKNVSNAPKGESTDTDKKKKVCKDRWSILCPRYAKEDGCKNRRDFLRKYCPQSCGVCDKKAEKQKNEKKKCKDRWSHACPKYAKKDGCTKGMKETLRKNCPVSCGICKEETTNDKEKPIEKPTQNNATATSFRKQDNKDVAKKYKSAPKGKIRLGILVTSSEKEDYMKEGRTWDDLVNTLKTDSQTKLSNALSPNAEFPYNMEVTVANVIEVDSDTAFKWLNFTAHYSFAGLLQTSKYAKEKMPEEFDVAVLVFSKTDGMKHKPPNTVPFGFTLNSAACGGKYKYGNAIHLYGQIRKYTKELYWHRLLAHELGHQMGAHEGPRDKNNECYDIMSFTPWRIPETQLWKSCSIKRIKEVREKGELSCLGL